MFLGETELNPQKNPQQRTTKILPPHPRVPRANLNLRSGGPDKMFYLNREHKLNSYNDHKLRSLVPMPFHLNEKKYFLLC